MKFLQKFWKNLRKGYYSSYLQNYIFDVVENDNSFNPVEIQWSKYYLEYYWQKENRNCKVHWLHNLNNVRIPSIYEAYFTPNNLTDFTKLEPKEELKKLKVLDVGCGGGICSEALARLNFNVTGIDPDPHMILVANLHAKEMPELREKKLKYIKTTIEDFHTENRGKYDIVVISEVLERIPHNKKRKFLEKCTSCLKVNGDLFITTRNRTIYSFLEIIIFGLSNRAHFGQHMWGRGISTHLLRKHLTSCGCDIRRIQGLFYDGLDRNFYYRENNDGWYFVHAIKRRLII